MLLGTLPTYLSLRLTEFLSVTVIFAARAVLDFFCWVHVDNCVCPFVHQDTCNSINYNVHVVFTDKASTAPASTPIYHQHVRYIAYKNTRTGPRCSRVHRQYERNWTTSTQPPSLPDLRNTSTGYVEVPRLHFSTIYKNVRRTSSAEVLRYTCSPIQSNTLSLHTTLLLELAYCLSLP